MPDYPKQTVFYISELEGTRWFYEQLLRGDNCDWIPGVYKLTGQKATKKILAPLEDLNTEKEMWAYVLEVYMSRYTPWVTTDIEDEKVYAAVVSMLTETGRLLFMLREPLLEDKSNLWCPPGD